MHIERIEGSAMTVNSFLVHGPDGIVLVDGQLTTSDAVRVRDAIGETGADLAGAIVTHPHPDHYAGLATIVGSRSIPIVATAEVDRVMRRDDELKDSIVGPMMSGDWPEHRIFPNEVVTDGTAVTLGGLGFRVEEVGPAESDADSVWRIDSGDVFAGDLAYNDHHAYLADGNWTTWIAVLDRLGRELVDATAIHLGHGASTDASVFARQRRYVETFVTAVEHNLAAVVAGDHAGVLSEMADAAAVTRDDLAFLMELSIDPVAAALRGEHS